MTNKHFKSFNSSWKNSLAFLALMLCLALFKNNAYAQDPPQYGTPFAGVPDPRDINMYQVNIRPFSAGSNLAGVNARMQNIKDLSTNVVYLMPVFPVGTDSRSKVASSTSPYSIKDFKNVGAEYGSLADLRAVVDNAHSKGMAVILDWVVNQTSWDHPWITQHPDWYVRNNGVIQQLGSFADVAALDMNNTTMRAAMLDAMRYWVFAANIDGFRCDYANNAPLPFWSAVISNLRGITSHKLIMFAEGDRLENFQTGFDLNFGDKWYYDALKPIRNGASVAQIQTTTNTEYTHATGSQQVVRYTGNHDSNGDGTPIEQLGSTAAVMANFVVSAYMRGVPFLYGSQEVAFATRIPWPWDGVDINWTPNAPVTAEFTKVLNFRTASNAIRRGAMTNYSDANICAFTKIAGTEKVVVLTNLRNGTFNYTIPSALAGTYNDAYTGATVTLTAGAQFSLVAYQYRTLTSSNVATIAVTGVTVSPTTASLAVNATSQLTATVAPANATNKTVSWVSSNTAVATVSAAGLVTAKAAGTATITVTTQDGNKTANATITVTGGAGTVYYQIKNRWQANSYLYDGGNGQVKYGTSATTTSYQWTRVDVGGGYFLLKNRATGNIMHVENQNGSVQCSAANPTWWSAMWSIPTTADGYNTMQNRWQTSQMIHIENLLGYAQYSGAQTGWYSAMWQFVNPVTVP
jgi:hypothetical protein